MTNETLTSWQCPLCNTGFFEQNIVQSLAFDVGMHVRAKHTEMLFFSSYHPGKTKACRCGQGAFFGIARAGGSMTIGRHILKCPMWLKMQAVRSLTDDIAVVKQVAQQWQDGAGVGISDG